MFETTVKTHSPPPRPFSPAARLCGLAAVSLASLSLLAGCDAESAAQCPDVSGSWEVVEHCSDSVIGEQYPVEQSGCSVTADTGVFVTEIELSLDGSFEAEIILLGTLPITCTGAGDTEELTMSCPEVNCEVRMIRVGG